MSQCCDDSLVPGTLLTPCFIIDAWQGPTSFLIRCQHCEGYALLGLLHWSGPSISVRVFSVAGIDAGATDTFLRNMRSDYCDLSRHQAEVDALIAVAAPVGQVIVCRLPEMKVEKVMHPSAAPYVRAVSWREHPPQDGDPRWAEILKPPRDVQT